MTNLVYHNDLVCTCGKPNTLVSALGDKSGVLWCIKCEKNFTVDYKQVAILNEIN